MKTKSIQKYRPFPAVSLPDRTWPDKTITHAPIWASVDLRDGNQALPQPMTVDEKIEIEWQRNGSVTDTIPHETPMPNYSLVLLHANGASSEEDAT